MGTRSIIAEPVDNWFRGRYCHWDGAPRNMGRELHAIVRAHGLDDARRTLLYDNRRWESIWHDRTLEQLIELAPDDEAIRHVVGYGNAVDIAGNDRWFDKSSDVAGWAYVLGDQCISILDWTTEGWLPVGELPYDQDIDDHYLRVAECGENYERCSHYVWAHEPDAPEDVRNLGMYTYMGHDERGWDQVVALIVNGKRIPITRSGQMGTARSAGFTRTTGRQARYWWSYLGPHNYVRSARILTSGAYKLEHPAVLAPTKTEPELEVAKGTVLR